MHLTDIDLRLLDVFVAVVESRGIASAQTLLNRDASTISRQLRQLEERLKLRLCERGRSGFSLTPHGERVYRETLALNQALRRFEERADRLRGQLSGHVHLAMIDNLITDPNCPLKELLARYGARSDNQVQLHVDVFGPAQIEQALLDHRADVGIGIFPTHLEELDYQPLYAETDWLVCSPFHPLAQAESLEEVQDTLGACAKVARQFLNAQDTRPLGGEPGRITAWVSNIEAAALLILAGTHVGFLPSHYARRWLESGQMVAIRPEHYQRRSIIELAVPRRKETPHPAVAAFRQDLATIVELGGLPARDVR